MCVTAIDDLSDIKLFGEDIVRLYNYDVLKSYELIKNNTNYLDNITIEQVRDIKFSVAKDIIILLNDGEVLLNENRSFSNIKSLIFMSGAAIFGISNDK